MTDLIRKWLKASFWKYVVCRSGMAAYEYPLVVAAFHLGIAADEQPTVRLSSRLSDSLAVVLDLLPQSTLRMLKPQIPAAIWSNVVGQCNYCEDLYSFYFRPNCHEGRCRRCWETIHRASDGACLPVSVS